MAGVGHTPSVNRILFPQSFSFYSPPSLHFYSLFFFLSSLPLPLVVLLFTITLRFSPNFPKPNPNFLSGFFFSSFENHFDIICCRNTSMVSDSSPTMVNNANANAVSDKSLTRSFSGKKNHGKLPRKIHKAEREKLKRDHLNDLFVELGASLDPTRQNNGKASILGDANRLLRVLLAQVERLKRENVALLSESHYMTAEKNELRDEKAVLEAEIEKLHTQVKERTPTKPVWNARPAESEHTNLTPSFPKDQLTFPVREPAFESPPVVGPILVIPLHPDFQTFAEPGTAQAAPKAPSNVSRPHARYPTPSDSWPSQLLGEQLKKRQEDLSCNSSKTN